VKLCAKGNRGSNELGIDPHQGDRQQATQDARLTSREEKESPNMDQKMTMQNDMEGGRDRGV